MIKIEVHSTRAVIRYQEPLTVGLRGAKVRFSFGAPWEGLTKTAVFRQGEKTVTVADVGLEATIPSEVLTVAGMPVQIGIYGFDSTGTVAIPTVWTETAAVRPGADPEGDPSTEPTPGLWEQLQGKLGSLEQLDTADKSSLVGAINEANRAVCLVTVTDNRDGTYSANKTLEALEEAWISGKPLICRWPDFEIYLPLTLKAQDEFHFVATAQNTEYHVAVDRYGTTCSTIILATDQDKLPNPNKLIFTGAVETEYDGSNETQVQIPAKTSELENDSGFLTASTAPVTSVNGQTGDVKLPTVVKVTITEQADGTIEPDLPHEDILAAYNAGNTVCCEYKGRLLSLIVASQAICSFGCVHSGKVYAVNITRASTVASVVPLTSGDTGSAPADAVLHTPQDLTPEQQAQARLNIGVSQKQEVEVVLNDVGASLVDASVKTVFDAIDAGNTVVLYRNTEDGTRAYYQLTERKEVIGGGESLTFTYRSTVEIDDIILHRGGFFDGSIGHGTENLTADTVGAVPAPMTAEIGQAMCVTGVDENGKPVEWKAADLAGGIKPVAKTEDMTQPVGVDELGGLWSVPGGGSGGGFNDNPLELINEITLEQQAGDVTISTDSSGEAFELTDFYFQVHGKIVKTGTGFVPGSITLTDVNNKEYKMTGLSVAVRSDEALTEQNKIHFLNAGQALFMVTKSSSGNFGGGGGTALHLMTGTVDFPINKVSVGPKGSDNSYLEGANFKLYGRRVKK